MKVIFLSPKYWVILFKYYLFDLPCIFQVVFFCVSVPECINGKKVNGKAKPKNARVTL